jgi:monofunctional chorismate mutase
MERELLRYRSAINRIDRRVVRLLKKRLTLVKQVGRLKRKLGVAVVQPEREGEILSRVTHSVPERETRDFLTAVYRALFKASYRAEGDGEGV